MSLPEFMRDVNGSSMRNLIFSIMSGFIFSLGWWIIIFAAVLYTATELPHQYHTAGVFTTLAFILLNSIPIHSFNNDSSDNLIGKRGALFCLFLACLMLFSGVIAAIWILFGTYVNNKEIGVWPGVAVFLQNILICGSALIYRFGRKEVDDF